MISNRIVHDAINRHGINVTYKSITTGSYDVNTSSVTNTETLYTVKTYFKHIKAAQYYAPNLVGKDAGIFYLAADDLSFIPKAQDIITLNSKNYTVDTVHGHSFNGRIMLYKLIAAV